MFAAIFPKAAPAACLGALLLQGCAQPWTRASHIPASSALSCRGSEPSLEPVWMPDLMEVNDLLSSESVVFFDVRRREEHERGHIRGRRLLNIDYLSHGFLQHLAALDRDVTYVVYCQCGGRSTETVKLMMALGFKHILHYREGYALYIADPGTPPVQPTLLLTEGN